MFLAASEAYRRAGAMGDLRIFCGDIPQGEPDKAQSYFTEDGDYFVLRDAAGKVLASATEIDGDVCLLQFPKDWPTAALLDVPDDEDEDDGDDLAS
jgi:hypothetical protein